MMLSLPLILLLGAWAIPGGFGDRAPLTATAPQLDDEEKYSAHMPAHLRCDACRAVVYQPLLVLDVAIFGKGRGQASYPRLRGAAAEAERVCIHRRPGPELHPDLAGLWDPRSEPGETSHRPRTQQGARANHQCDDHRGPLADQALHDMFALPGGVWRRPDL
ncbi:marginal zone B- and B1-cell-specific protein isoform X2 [Lontra canadensis]|uniref:marginal zone B- and B1-cell-specific protein isoform X2 n=1 Tax=Lontra canadensis TaxID=76717 RepID=UPI0013F2C29A|nr:marginal zone B- and B1-cell-specific protein isoform X2 [Lontra canadensis]